MTHYELMVIIDPSLSEADNKKTLGVIEKIIKDAKGKITKEDMWWEKKLAYPIKGSEKGFYALYQIELDGTAIKSINNLFNLEKTIWRFMFVNQEV